MGLHSTEIPSASWCAHRLWLGGTWGTLLVRVPNSSVLIVNRDTKIELCPQRTSGAGKSKTNREARQR
jgi:hypothetical protein